MTDVALIDEVAIFEVRGAVEKAAQRMKIIPLPWQRRYAEDTLLGLGQVVPHSRRCGRETAKELARQASLIINEKKASA